MKQRNPNHDWPYWLLCIFVLAAIVYAYQAKAETEVGAFGAHWSKHWLSESITNEKHALACLRVEFVMGCRFNNSFKQEGFSGESYSLGLVKDFDMWTNINRWNGDIVMRGSVGATYGYTTFAGHDWSDKDIHGYIAGGPLYQQPIEGTNGEWEAGFLQFGDATLPGAGLSWRF